MIKKGFTLIEILFVVLLIAVLSAIAVNQYQKAVDKSRYAALFPTAKSLKESQESFYMANSFYAKNLGALMTRAPGNITGNTATISDGITVEISTEEGYSYVKMTSDKLKNNYIIYQNNSTNYPNEIHCEAEEGSWRAEQLCEEFDGVEISGSLTEGYKTYVLQGSGQGIPASLAREAEQNGNHDAQCDEYPCTKECDRTVKAGFTCSVTYNEDHSYSEKVCSDGICLTTAYDENGKKRNQTMCKEDAQKGVCNEVLSNAYDENGHLIDQKKDCIYSNSDGSCKAYKQEISWTYDENGNILEKNFTNLTEFDIYDDQGRLVASQHGSYPFGEGYKEYIYDENGRLIETKGQWGSSTIYTYDENGKLLSAVDAYGNGDTYEYDEDGNLLTKTTSQWASTYVYDANGKLIAIKSNYEDREGTYTYDENGKLISSTDGWGNTTTYEYDDQGNLIHKAISWGEEETYTYNENGKLTSVTDQYGSTITYTYDENGRVISETKEDLTNTYTYDENGRLIASETQWGQIHDPLKGPYEPSIESANQWGSGNTKMTYTYDDDGNLLSATKEYESGATTTTNYSYEDGFLFLQNGMSYTYDEDGRLISTTNQYGCMHSVTYDSQGNILSEEDASPYYSNPSVVSYQYDENGNILSKTTENPWSKTTETYTYDEDGSLVSKTTQYGSGGDPNNPISTSTVVTTYDKNGNQTSEESVWYQSEDYNSSSKITYEDGKRVSYEETHTYPWGEVGSSNYSYTYNDDGLPTSRTQTYEDGSSSTESFDLSHFYDENGQLIGTIKTSSDNQYGCFYIRAYDDQGKLIAQQDASFNCPSCNTQHTTYTYDDNGNVINKHYQYGTDPNGSDYTYTYNDDGKITSYTYTSQYSSSSVPTYYTYDESGYVSSVTNMYGNVGCVAYYSPEDQAYVNEWGGVNTATQTGSQYGSWW